MNKRIQEPPAGRHKGRRVTEARDAPEPEVSLPGIPYGLDPHQWFATAQTWLAI